MTNLPEGVRLAKRVAALQHCSRSQAEALIASGAVQVDGQVVTDPARRVSDSQAVQLMAAAVHGAVTVLLHKPAGVPAATALHGAWSTLAPGHALPAGLREWMPLPLQASGLSVWSDDPPIVRRLLDRARPLEAEWRLSLPLAGADPVMAALQRAGARVSLSHQREGWGQWRLVAKGLDWQEGAGFLDAYQFSEGWGLHRQRIGRLGLSPLSPGQARWCRDFEKF
jgi:23S rRNA pseudouridine2604 synthase